MRYDPEQANKSKRVAYLKGYDEGYKKGTDDTVKRFLIHADHADLTPSKAKRYEKLLAFVKNLEKIEDSYMSFELCDVREESKNLLNEIGENNEPR